MNFNYATPYILKNPQDQNEEVVIFGNYIAIQGYKPFDRTKEMSPINLDIELPDVSYWTEITLKKASMFHSDSPIGFIESDNEKVNAILATVLTDVESLTKLSKNKSSKVRELVAQHNIPEILHELKNDENVFVRFEVLKHNNTDILLSMLKEDFNVNQPALVEMSKHNNQCVIDEILNIVMNDQRMENSNADLIFANIISHGNKENINKIVEYTKNGKDLGVYSLTQLSKQDCPQIHNKILEEMLDAHCHWYDCIANIASYGNKENLEKIISLAEIMPELQDDYFYGIPLKAIVEQDIKEFQLRIAKMDSPLLKQELKKSKHLEVLKLVGSKIN